MLTMRRRWDIYKSGGRTGSCPGKCAGSTKSVAMITLEGSWEMRGSHRNDHHGTSHPLGTNPPQKEAGEIT